MGRWIVQYLRMRARDRFDEFDYFFWRSASDNGHRQVDTPQAVAKCPVGYILSNELRVGYDDFRSLRSAHDAGTDADRPTLP